MSFQKQTFTNDKVIIVDDGSKPSLIDSSPSIEDNEKQKLYRNDSSKDAERAREMGRLIAQGKYIDLRISGEVPPHQNSANLYLS